MNPGSPGGEEDPWPLGHPTLCIKDWFDQYIYHYIDKKCNNNLKCRCRIYIFTNNLIFVGKKSLRISSFPTIFKIVGKKKLKATTLKCRCHIYIFTNNLLFVGKKVVTN